MLSATVLYCLDINECTTMNGNCSELCSNTAGSYECSCNAGHQLASDGSTCIGEIYYFSTDTSVYTALNSPLLKDINECLLNNGFCSQVCVNTNGSFYCLCRSGFQLGDGNADCKGNI